MPPTTIRVRPGTDEELASGEPQDQLVAAFRHPVTGALMPVTITFFQSGSDPSLMGVGIYTADEAGNPARGTVIRWDNGPDAEPAVIRWEARHCEDDRCGSPCRHRRPGRRRGLPPSHPGGDRRAAK